MRSFQVYRNIRSRALIFGLPVGSFAIQMSAVIASLLVVIFSFKFWLLVLLPALNAGLYVGLIRGMNLTSLWVRHRGIQLISNKKISIGSHEA